MAPSVPALLNAYLQGRPPDPVALARRLQRLNAPEADRSTAQHLIVTYADAHNANTLIEGYMPGARLDAAIALPLLGLDSVTDVLLEWLHDWAPETRQAAILALGRTGAARAIAPLLQIALTDDHKVHLGEPPGHPGHWSLRYAAILALEAIGTSEALAAMSMVPAETRAQVAGWRSKSWSALARSGY